MTITEPNIRGIKSDFSGCDIRLQSEFLGPEYEMDDSTRQNNLGRIAAAKAFKSSPEIEI